METKLPSLGAAGLGMFAFVRIVRKHGMDPAEVFAALLPLVMQQVDDVNARQEPQ